MKSFHAPLYEKLEHHANTNPASFHVPGHHNGKSLQFFLQGKDQLKDITDRFNPIMEIDLTEISSTDDLHHPEGPIKEAQRLAAKCFGSDDTYFLVGGSTSGNLALLLTVCKPGETIIVQRNVHKSIINGLKLAGAKAVFLTPQIDESSGLATIPSLEQVCDALLLYPEAKAVFLTNPNYYGISIKLDHYVEAVHRIGIPLLVDEAHGAHYGLHPELPESALAAGADAVVQSTHKTLPALTMGAMLHVQGNRLDTEELRQSLAMIQSSSPSFPIMASLDISRAMVQALGFEMFQPALDAVHSFKRWVNDENMIISVMRWGEASTVTGLRQLDPLRVLLYDQSGQLSGFELLKELEQYGCWAEMADSRYVVLVMGVHTNDSEIEKLKVAVVSIHNKYKNNYNIVDSHQKNSKLTVTTISLNDKIAIGAPVSFSRRNIDDSEIVIRKLRECEGLHSAQMIVPYPPGIPLLYPGEKLTTEIIDQIENLASAGAKFQGVEDITLTTIKVFLNGKKE
ncbi:aminotransferase class I/II-fold pyridoxal phosphate-dependent enzyme [Paenibacillus sp. L3-i20]|uniref:aminotransferase class I/II-fold pyridoxal phosphate-dependent enzyme n=1 Tax=Paenibacillus sp. L3-i20 TaxID=2905833 RepID=UPI001EDE4F21|nr:aminotransferase class I/II-fold pyridoxal phosphate-dependent enzyme [Paenibacillus sp. L3-i20]GKU77118.1 lysine decarboxylase [Paenibacillus sp. L3-i20]